MSINQSLKDMINVHIARILNKIPIASQNTRGTVKTDNRTLHFTDDTLMANHEMVDSSLILVTSPLSENTNTVFVSDKSNIELYLSAEALICNNYITYFELTYDDKTIIVYANNNECDCCLIDRPNKILAVAVDNDNNRSLATTLYIEVVSPTIHKPNLLLPNTHIVNSNTTIPYVLSNIKSVPYTTDYTCQWELTNSNGEVLWNTVTRTNYTSGPIGNSLTSLSRSKLYEIAINDSISKRMINIVNFKDCLWYTTDEPNCIYKYKTDHTKIDIPQLRYSYKSYSDDKIFILCSMLYLAYTYNGINWSYIQHPSNIVDVIHHDDIIYMLSNNGTVHVFDLEIMAYLSSIVTGIKSCTNMCKFNDGILIAGYEKVISIDDCGRVSELLHIDNTQVQYVCILDGLIIVLTKDTIYRYTNSWDKQYVEYIITNAISNNHLLCMTTPNNDILITDKYLSLSILNNVPNIDNISILNNVCYLSDKYTCYITKPIIPLSEEVTLSAKYIATDARYPLSESAIYSYRYRLR